jgi:hypothetical protein
MWTGSTLSDTRGQTNSRLSGHKGARNWDSPDRVLLVEAWTRHQSEGHEQVLIHGVANGAGLVALITK